MYEKAKVVSKHYKEKKKQKKKKEISDQSHTHTQRDDIKENFHYILCVN